MKPSGPGLLFAGSLDYRSSLFAGNWSVQADSIVGCLAPRDSAGPSPLRSQTVAQELRIHILQNQFMRVSCKDQARRGLTSRSPRRSLLSPWLVPHPIQEMTRIYSHPCKSQPPNPRPIPSLLFYDLDVPINWCPSGHKFNFWKVLSSTTSSFGNPDHPPNRVPWLLLL